MNVIYGVYNDGTKDVYVPFKVDSEGKGLIAGLTVVSAASFTRPADTTAYSIGDLVANSTSPASVVALSIPVTRVNAGSCIIRKIQLYKSSNTLTGANFRIHLFNTVPVMSVGDNAQIILPQIQNYIGRCDITLDQAFSNGAWGSSDITFSDQHVNLPSGKNIYALIEVRSAYTPTSAEVFTLSLEVIQD